MAEPTDWQQLILSGFIGAGFAIATQWLVLLRREKNDRDVTIRNHVSATHIKRKEHLGQLVALLLEFSQYAWEGVQVGRLITGRAKTQARLDEATKKGEKVKPPHRDLSDLEAGEATLWARYEKLNARCLELIPQIIVQAESYGDIPAEVTGLKDHHLGNYADRMMALKIRDVMDVSLPSHYTRDSFGHLYALIADLRDLIKFEAESAQLALGTQRIKNRVAPPCPYLRDLAPYFDGQRTDVSKLDTSFLEHQGP